MKKQNKAFLEIDRKTGGYRPVEERVGDYAEVERGLTEKECRDQASRCMGCGVPFCHGAGCPLENAMPEINTAVAEGRFHDAWELLSLRSNFPEFTGRVCPALCEAACAAGLCLDSVSVRQIELFVIEKAFEQGWVRPRRPGFRTGFKVAVIGSGPAGLVAADELNQAGHTVSVFEKNPSAGGILRYGIPDFKLDKGVIERRVKILREEGVVFELGTEIGVDMSAEYLKKRFDAIVLAVGTGIPRDLSAPGRELPGIHQAMDFLTQQNRRVSGEAVAGPEISAKGKKVVVIGGGDTGSDCVGTSRRQGAKSVTQIEIMPRPPDSRHASTPWPQWPHMLRTSSSHLEGCERKWSVITKKFSGNGRLERLHCAEAKWETDKDGRPVKFTEIPGSDFVIEADLAFLALGFTGAASTGGFIEKTGAVIGKRGMITADEGGATAPGVFAVGDAVAGPSLVVRAMADGKKVAATVRHYLAGLKK